MLKEVVHFNLSICPICGGESFTIIKDDEYDLDTHNNIITVTKVWDNCNCEINF